MKKAKIVILIVLVVAVVIGANWLIQRGTTKTSGNENAASQPTDDQYQKLAAKPVATIVTNYGKIQLRFYAADAPELSKNFIELAKQGYYDGLTFHRVVPDFVIQGGDPSGDGAGGHSYKGAGTYLDDEKGAQALRHIQGAVAWAKSPRPVSIGSQFYVALDPLPQLDGEYSVFAQVVKGMDVVEKIGQVPTSDDERPTTEVKIEKVIIAE